MPRRAQAGTFWQPWRVSEEDCMTIEGCAHGPTFVTGGPSACPECRADRTRSGQALATTAKALRSLETRPVVKPTEGPWYVSGDDALDCPDHADSGLAMVDTGRMGDWPIARLCEWGNARFIAAAGNFYERVLPVRAKHIERAKAVNFDDCGCDYCEAVQLLITEARGQETAK